MNYSISDQLPFCFDLGYVPKILPSAVRDSDPTRSESRPPRLQGKTPVLKSASAVG